MRVLAIVFLILAISACQEPIVEGPQQEYFFPLQDFMEKEIKRLRKQDVRLEKTVNVNNEIEIKDIIIQKADSAATKWNKELQPFITADINKATYIDQYTTTYDTLSNGNVWLIYQTENEDLNTQALKILKSGETIKAIEAITHTNNPIYRSNQKLTYYPDSAYSIEAIQDVRLTEEKKFKVEAKILN